MKNKKKITLIICTIGSVLLLLISLAVRSQLKLWSVKSSRPIVKLRKSTIESSTPTVKPFKFPVKPYKIKKDLTNIVNLEDFKKAIEYYTTKEFSFSDEQKKKLIENGFVVVPSNAEQFFHIYESSHFGIEPRIPNFITTDCILQLYHLLYDFTLRIIEVELLPSLRKLTQAMLEESKKQYEKITTPMVKAACLKNISFFAVAVKLLGIGEISLSS
jgi:hypothetical protein